MLVSYFGETKSVDCEVCDVCLRKRRKEMNKKKSLEIEKVILATLAEHSCSITEIISIMNHFKENDVLTILRILIEDGRVEEEGEILKMIDLT